MSTRQTLSFFVLVFVVMCFAITEASDENDTAASSDKKFVLVNFRVCHTKEKITQINPKTGEILNIVDPNTDYDTQPGGRLSVGIAEFKIGETILRANENGLSWNGENEPPDNSEITLLSSPRLLAKLGEDAEIHVSAGEQVEYFEKLPDGRFKHQKLPIFEHVYFTVKPIQCSPEFIILDVTFSIELMGKRVPIAGVALDVGQPVINKRSVSSRICIRPKEWAIMSMVQDENVLLFCMQAEIKSLEEMKKELEKQQ